MKSNVVRSVVTVAAVVALAGAAVAQQSRGGAGRGTGVDTANVVALQGEVISFQAGFGQGMPELIVRDDAAKVWTLVLGPFTYLQDQGFAANPGDRVDVRGFSCPTCEHGVAVAAVTNLTSGITLKLRNDDGTPVWIGGAGQPPRQRLGGGNPSGHGAGAGSQVGPTAGNDASSQQRAHKGLCGGQGPDLGRVTTFSGPVVGFIGGQGVGTPTLVVDTAAGDVTVLLSPYRALLQAGYTPEAGTQVEVSAAPVLLDGVEHWVALSLTDTASGLVIVLRDAGTGLPAAPGRGPRF